MVKEDEKIPEFSLFGGPLHLLGSRLGLVCEGVNATMLGVVLGLLSWGILVLLALMQGLGHKMFSLAVIGIHVRLLVAIPLFFVCESWVLPQMAEFVRNIRQSGVVPRNVLPALASEIVRIARWKDSWLSEAMCLLMAVILPLIGTQLHLVGVTSTHDASRSLAEGTLASGWYWIVCLPLFRFLLVRWLWRIGLWWYFLWRVSELDLNLVPTHPDGAAGMGYLEVVHIHFTPMIAAFSAVQAASFAEDISAGRMTFDSIYQGLVLILLLQAVLFLGPLFTFSVKLWACRVKGLSDYMAFAAQYVNGFDRKWLGTDSPPKEPLLGTPDLQSLADLSNSVGLVRNMRTMPLSMNLLANVAAAALLPIVPLFLLKYPVAELAKKLFATLTGL
jgi:hypothetical protein